MTSECTEKRSAADVREYVIPSRDAAESVRRDWERHLTTCAACRAYAAIYSILGSHLGYLAQAGDVPACGGPTAAELDEFLMLDVEERNQGRFRRIKQHLEDCDPCRILAQSIEVHFQSKPSIVGSISHLLDPGALRTYLEEFMAQIEALLATPPAPVFAPAMLGGDLLRAAAPIGTTVRAPFAFRWMKSVGAASYSLSIAPDALETSNAVHVTVRPEPDARLVRCLSDNVPILWVPGSAYAWEVTALGDRDEHLASTRALSFQLAEETDIERVERTLAELKPKLDQPPISVVAKAAVLARENLYDDAIELLETEGAGSDRFLTAALVSLLGRRLEGAQSGDKRQLQVALRAWKAVLASL